MSKKEHAKTETPLSAVSALMEERRRFESWLEALEARRDTTPERVFTRVHADYSARLEQVISQLSTHGVGLREQLSSLTTRLAEIADAQQAARDERAEAELRAHVGELSDDAWKTLAAESDAKIGELSEAHDRLEQELARTREILAEAQRPPTPIASVPAVPAVPAEPVAAAASEDVSDQAEQVLHVPAAEAPAEPAPKKPEPEEEVPAQPELGLGAPPRPSGAKPRPRTGSFDELAFLSSVVDESATPPAPKRRDSFAVRAPEAPIENLDSTADNQLIGRSAATPMAANVSGNHPVVIKDKPAEGAKTLKCAECGTMNYPTEWYCERCGAELASL